MKYRIVNIDDYIHIGVYEELLNHVEMQTSVIDEGTLQLNKCTEQMEKDNILKDNMMHHIDYLTFHLFMFRMIGTPISMLIGGFLAHYFF